MSTTHFTFTSTKTLVEIGPCAYRNWKSDSDCFLLHGYCRSFHFIFGAHNLDQAGFVVDFGGLKIVKNQLQVWFDHTTILQADDPLVPTFRQLSQEGLMNLKTFPSISCEGLAQYVGTYVAEYINRITTGRAHLLSCEVREADKNSSIYNYYDDPDKLTFQELQDYNRELEEANPGR